MKLVAQDPKAVLFETGEVIESAEVVPPAGNGRAVLVVDFDQAAARRWISPAQAYKDNLGVVDATKEELAMLRGAGYALPVVSAKQAIK